jgi:hypothetical protein
VVVLAAEVTVVLAVKVAVAGLLNIHLLSTTAM